MNARSMKIFLCAIITSSFFMPLIGQEEKEPIKVMAVSETKSKQGEQVYLIKYDYKFEGHESVYIEELGTVPAEGEFTYFTNRPVIDDNHHKQLSQDHKILVFPIVMFLGPLLYPANQTNNPAPPAHLDASRNHANKSKAAR